MKKFTMMFTCLGLLCFSNAFSQSGFSTDLLFVAKLVGEQEVPPVTTNAIGEASFSLNENRDSLCINVTVKGLSGPITGAHIHEGPIGGTGSIVVSLVNNTIGNRISAVITAPTLDNLFLYNLINGSFYINVHTAANPSGEIRGQIELESDWPYMAKLDGIQETPSVVTNATGLAVFDLSRSMIALKIKAIFENLSGPITGIHLHNGAVGVSGPVIMDLMPGLVGNRLDISVPPDSFISELNAGTVYINVHTAANPNGEIRGQLVRQKSLSFDANINGLQETPSVLTSASGVGLISFNASMDTIWFDFATTGLSSTPSAVHFHTASPGVSGPVVINLSSSINGNQLNGIVTGSGIPAGFLDECLKGNVYVNFHTGANPNGEIRGQMMRYAREGFTYSIDATQETSGSTSSASGSGMASFDRDAEDLHFRMIVVGLTDTIQAAHFHHAAAGSPGPTIFDLTPFFTHTSTDDGAFNYWKRVDGFDSSKVALFLANEVYVNIHTANFPDGEIRGQVIRGGVCNVLNIGIPEIPLTMDFKMFPNPAASDRLNISFDGLVNAVGNIVLTDVSGRIVDSYNISIEKGSNSYEFPLRINPGVYLVSLSVGEIEQFKSKLVRY